MADLKKPTLRIVDIDENYQAPADAKPEELQKAAYAKAMREGAKRAGVKHVAEVAGIKQAHTDELNRTGKIVSRAAHRDGLLQGIVLGMIAAICVGLATWTVLREVVITNVNVARTPAAAVPVLQYQEAPTSYPRDNPREPGDAPRP